MLAFPSMLVPSAEQAGITCPPDPESYDMRDFPHFSVFCLMQLGAPIPNMSSVSNNAHVIASVPDDHIMLVTPSELIENGFEIGMALP